MIREPSAGRMSTLSAAPETEMSASVAGCSLPLDKPERRSRIARNHALVAPVFRQAERSAIGEPRELIRKPVALGRREARLDREAAGKNARDRAFDPPDLIQIGDDSLAGRDGRFRAEGDAAGGHVERDAVEFLPVGAHETSGQADLDPLVAAALDGGGLRDMESYGAQARAPRSGLLRRRGDPRRNARELRVEGLRACYPSSLSGAAG